MPSPSPLTPVLFCALVVVVAVGVAWALRRAGVGLPGWLAALAAYLILPGLLAARGALDRYSPLPAPALLLLLGLSLLTLVLVASPLGARLAGRLAVGAVVAVQAFRIPVELLLHRLYVEGTVPVQMTYSGRNFDVVTGVTGVAVGLGRLAGRPAPRGLVLAWNLLGLALLANIVGVAVLSTPAPFRRFLEGPPNLVPSEFPYVWLPSFLVQVAWGSHLLVFRQLRRGTRPDRPDG
jgi:hypothetical protein